ncbi:MAG: class I SAM-dependent methyltransferase [bacterium]
MDSEKVTFSFGKNWEQFIKSNFSEERVEITKTHLLGFLELENLKGKYFLDIGCGSGLHSLAAFKAGAERIVSVDLDPYSVKTTETVREMHGNPSNWEILSGSILDRQFVSGLDPADVVYSWGVLHHTGKMWEAIENTGGLMKSDGLLYIALYTTNSKSDHWLKVKIKYNNASNLEKRLMEFQHVLRYTIIPQCIHLQNPLKTIRQYKQKRGMSFMTDVKDWLGGYPYEHAKIEEVLRFCRSRFDHELINIKTGEANTEYLFRKRM